MKTGTIDRKTIELGLKAADSDIYDENEIWSRYSNDKVDIGEELAGVLRTLSKDQSTTTWLYNHFAGKFFGCRNDQDLLKFKRELESTPLFKRGQILSRTDRVHFFVDDFGKFMAVAWMILLYPEVHKYTLRQREEITEFVYRKFWLKKKPLVQMQNHLVLYRGIGFKGLI